MGWYDYQTKLFGAHFAQPNTKVPQISTTIVAVKIRGITLKYHRCALSTAAHNRAGCGRMDMRIFEFTFLFKV